MVKFGYGQLLNNDFHKVLQYQDLLIDDLKPKEE